MIYRGDNFKQVPLNIVGSSTFGRYPKISQEKTYNMFESDSFMVPYSGYQIAISSKMFDNGKEGRGIFTSTKFNRLVVIVDANVYLVNIVFSQQNLRPVLATRILIGTLQTKTGITYIAENNKPQIGISDGVAFYLYDPLISPVVEVQTLNFTPGYLTFHDTYFILSASNDTTYDPPANNTWRLSGQNDGTTWNDDAASVGLLQSKPDDTQAVVRFPSKGNLIFVMGSITTEAWFDTGAQLFPYQRNNQFNIDYGCLSAASVAYMDELVVWLAANEKSGPVIMYSDGGMPNKITTDGIDYLLSTLQNPQDSQGFLYRQDGHLFYHINFYSDNLSLFYDFNTHKFYHACDQNLNYFIASEIAFFNNQYYFVSRNSGNLYAFDTGFNTYQDVDALGNVITNEIPRFRITKNIRSPDQEYRIINDIGFTIETGETNYQQQNLGSLGLIAQNGSVIVSQGDSFFISSQNDNYIVAQNGNYIVSQQQEETGNPLMAQQNSYFYATPIVNLSMSYDGGATFGQRVSYVLNPIGQRRNKLMWWQLGIANDAVPQFEFWGMGRFVITDGITNLRR